MFVVSSFVAFFRLKCPSPNQHLKMLMDFCAADPCFWMPTLMFAPVSPIRLCHLFRRFHCEAVNHPYVLIISSVFGWSGSMFGFVTLIETTCSYYLLHFLVECKCIVGSFKTFMANQRCCTKQTCEKFQRS